MSQRFDDVDADCRNAVVVASVGVAVVIVIFNAVVAIIVVVVRLLATLLSL